MYLSVRTSFQPRMASLKESAVLLNIVHFKTKDQKSCALQLLLTEISHTDKHTITICNCSSLKSHTQTSTQSQSQSHNPMTESEKYKLGFTLHKILRTLHTAHRPSVAVVGGASRLRSCSFLTVHQRELLPPVGKLAKGIRAGKGRRTGSHEQRKYVVHHFPQTHISVETEPMIVKLFSTFERLHYKCLPAEVGGL